MNIFLKEYCEVYVGNDSRMPVVRLAPRGTSRKCPMLKNQKCRVHRAKPTICAMFPIGRCLVGKRENDGTVKESEIQYIFTNPGCGDDSETHTVRKWLKSFGIPVHDEFFPKWPQLIFEMSRAFNDAEEVLDQSTMKKVWAVVFAWGYLDYSTEAEFMSQFEENIKKISELLDKLSSVITAGS